jgi:lipid-A-disaccharide synthase
MAYSTVMMVASGTATIESAILNTPFLVVYNVSPLSYWIGKRLINVKFIAMANIVANRKIVPEFIQKDYCTDKVIPELLDMYRNSENREQMKKGFQQIRKKLGSPGASKRVANLAISMMEKNG